MKEKIKSKKWILIVGGILILVSVIIGMAGKEKNSQQAQVVQSFQQKTEKGSQSIGEIQQLAEKQVEQSQNKQGKDSAAPEVSVTTSIVDYVVDGDTVELRSGERVRLIGINTPEMGQSYSVEAKNKLKELIEGKEVVLEKDITDKDQYGRLLRYIWLGDALINLNMVKLGYANSYTYPPDVKYQDQIVAAEKEAREKKIGLWSSG